MFRFAVDQLIGHFTSTNLNLWGVRVRFEDDDRIRESVPLVGGESFRVNSDEIVVPDHHVFGLELDSLKRKKNEIIVDIFAGFVNPAG